MDHVGTSKVCTKCGATKPVGEFAYRTDRKTLRAQCRQCIRESVSSRYGASETFRQSHRDAMRKYRFGIHLEEFNKMFEEQKGCCGICRRHQSESKKSFSVDHDHQTGTNRGLLCNECNLALGLFYDNAATLQAAIEYLHQHASGARVEASETRKGEQ